MKNKAQRILDALKEAEDQPSLPGMGKKKYSMNKTYQVVTPESAEQGDFSDQGIEYEDKEFDSLWEMADEIRNAGATELSSSGTASPHDWYSTPDPERNYRTGEETTYSFHPKGLSKEEAVELQKLVNMDHKAFSNSMPDWE